MTTPQEEMNKIANGENATVTPYVTFDACFEQGGVKYRGVHADLNNTVNLAINLNVQTNGTLKNGKIKFDSDRNYKLINNINTDDYIKSVTESTITFSDIPLGINKTINATLKQTPCNINNFDYQLNNLSKTNKLTFTGTHIASDGTETEISKDVYFHIDWYGDIQVVRYSDDYTQNKFILSEEEGKIYIVYTSYVYGINGRSSHFSSFAFTYSFTEPAIYLPFNLSLYFMFKFNSLCSIIFKPYFIANSLLFLTTN